MKKIAIFKPYNARPNNAFGSGQYPVFKKFKEYGYEVIFFLDDKNVKFDGVKNKYIKVKKISNFILRVFRKIFNIPYIKMPYYEDIDFNEYDIVITEGLHYPFLSYFDNYKGFLILNDTITAEKRIKKLNANLINKKFSNSYVVGVNEKMFLLYEKYGIKLEHSVIGHALNIDKIKFYKREKFNGKLLSIGRLVYEKGYEYIFQAMKKLVIDYPNLTLNIYGSGPLENELKRLVKKLNLENHIFLKDSLKYDDLMDKLKEYDLFISHPLETEYIAEAFHMGNMEAMTNGMPVITTDCGGVPYVVKDKAIICEQKSINDIVLAVKKLLEDKNLYSKMSEEGRKFIEDNYSLDVIVKKWISVLKNENKLND
jgi:glycosyltransferase involved in cell wall biosynthesis